MTECRALVARPEVLKKIHGALEGHRVALLIAGAGHGKTAVLQQFVNGRAGVRFAPAQEVAGKAFHGTGILVVDGIDALAGDAAAIERFRQNVERSPQTRFIVSARSPHGLPVGRWQAEGLAALILDGEALAFTPEELRARGLSEEEAREVCSPTGGWPLAVCVALEALERSGDVRRAIETAQDVAARYLDETIYATLPEETRDLLRLAAVLRVVDTGVLECAGFDRAVSILENLPISEPLMRLMRHKNELAGRAFLQALYLRAGRALEMSRKPEEALDAYVSGAHAPEARRLLFEAGFELLDRSCTDVVARAIAAMDEKSRSEDPTLLVLRAGVHGIEGRVSRAESLLRRAMTKAGRDGGAAAALRLALLHANQGRDASELLEPIAHDVTAPAAQRAEALSLLATQRAIAGDAERARALAGSAEQMLHEVHADGTTARVLQRIGVTAMHCGDPTNARTWLTQASDLTLELKLYSHSSRCLSALANLVNHYYDDADAQYAYASLAYSSAQQACNTFDLQTSMLQMMGAQIRRGFADQALDLENELARLASSDHAREHYIAPYRALRLAWEGRFSEAHAILATSWQSMHYDFDRLVCGSELALFLAMDGQKDPMIAVLFALEPIVEGMNKKQVLSLRCVALGALLCGLAEIVAGRITVAERRLRKLGRNPLDPVLSAVRSIADELLRSPRDLARIKMSLVDSSLLVISRCGHDDIARVFSSALGSAREKSSSEVCQALTNAERGVLGMLSDGLSPKEIATRRGISVFTVRAHVANSIAKLHCRGRSEALAVARKMGIIK